MIDSGLWSILGLAGANALLQAMGAGIAAGAPDAQAIARRDPGCCVAEYLDQPVAPYTVDVALDDGQGPAADARVAACTTRGLGVRPSADTALRHRAVRRTTGNCRSVFCS
jgi:hypothetical protein